MIEEVLEEQENKTVALIKQELGGGMVVGVTPLQKGKPNRFRIQLKKGHPKHRKDYAKQIEGVLKVNFPQPEYTIEDVLDSGRKFTIGHTVKYGRNIIFRYALKSGNTVGNVSEKFEGNLILALAKENDLQKANQTPPNFKFNNSQMFQNIAKIVVDKCVKLNNGLTFGTYVKVGNGKVTPLYSHYGVKSGTSKADIGGEGQQISVKKKSASLLSAEVGETCAIMATVLGLAPDNMSSEAQNLIIKIKQTLDKPSMASKNTEEKRETFDKLIVEIYEFFYGGFPKFKQKFIVEAMTGNGRFQSDEQKAFQLLKWDLDGFGDYHNEIGVWAEANTNLVGFDIRSRGVGRSAGVRLDPWVKSTLKQSNLFYRMYSKYGVMLEEKGKVLDFPTTLEVTDSMIYLSLLDFLESTIIVEKNGKGIVIKTKELQSTLVDQKPQSGDPAPDNVVALPTPTEEPSPTEEPLRRVAEHLEGT